jgi:hypothetical protein
VTVAILCKTCAPLTSGSGSFIWDFGCLAVQECVPPRVPPSTRQRKTMRKTKAQSCTPWVPVCRHSSLCLHRSEHRSPHAFMHAPCLPSKTSHETSMKSPFSTDTRVSSSRDSLSKESVETRSLLYYDRTSFTRNPNRFFVPYLGTLHRPGSDGTGMLDMLQPAPRCENTVRVAEAQQRRHRSAHVTDPISTPSLPPHTHTHEIFNVRHEAHYHHMRQTRAAATRHACPQPAARGTRTRHDPARPTGHGLGLGYVASSC